jgi:uncharacterized protein
VTSDRIVQTLTRSECDELLAIRQVGRVVLSAAALPTAVPVPYSMVGGDVVFRPGADVHLAPAGTVVAFEVDDFDVRARMGWSVIATGIAAVVTDADELLALAEQNVPSWLNVHDLRYVRLTLGPVSGQRVRAQDVPRAS